MRLLNRGDAEALLGLLVDDLPRQILGAVAREGGRREAQLVSELSRWFPRSVATQEVRTWVSDALDWFVVRGDVEKGFGGRYHCVPPHAIGDVDTPDGPELWLCGDPRVEPSLRQALQPFGVILTYKTVYAQAEGALEGASARSIPPTGIERSISSPPCMQAEVVRACESLGILIVEPNNMAAALPRLGDVVVPAERDLETSPVSAGLWEVYEPRTGEEARWRADANWRMARARLVRWRPSDDWRGERSARVFYHASDGRVAELGPEAASLWQLYLDAKAECHRTVWWDGARMWVPRMVPVGTQQWLRVLSGRSAYLRGGCLVLEMNEALAGTASATLVDTLGLRHQEGQPPGATPRYGQTKRRSAQ